MSIERIDLEQVNAATNTDKFYAAMHEASAGITVFHWGRRGGGGQTQVVRDPSGATFRSKVTAKSKGGYVGMGATTMSSWPERYAKDIEHHLSVQVAVSTAVHADLDPAAAISAADDFILNLTTQPLTAASGVTYAGLVDTKDKLVEALAEFTARIEVAQLLLTRAA